MSDTRELDTLRRMLSRREGLAWLTRRRGTPGQPPGGEPADDVGARPTPPWRSAVAAYRRRLVDQIRRASDRLWQTAAGRALQRVIQAVTRRWRRSLQLRIVTVTLLASSLLVAAFGFVLTERIVDGLVDAKLNDALLRLEYGRREAQQQLSALAGPDDPDLRPTVVDLVGELSDVPGHKDPIEVVLASSDPRILIDPVSPTDGAIRHVPPELNRLVSEQGVTAHQYTRASPDGEEPRPYLVVGTSVQLDWGTLELYQLVPLDKEVAAASMIRNTVLVTGSALVLLLALIAWIVTRMVVTPVRLAARTAQRLSAGLLHERMEVKGEDDLAKLAASFNQMAQNLQHQIVQLEELSRLQRRFTSDVSHELRTPLTTVRMAAEIIHTARDEFSEDVARSAELLSAELDRFENLLTDLLEISRFDAGFAHLEADATDMAQVIQRAVDSLASLADRQGVPIEVVTPEETVIAEVDARRVERVLRNLIGNAIEHGDGKPVIVTLAANPSAVAVTVRDHGIGLKPGEEKLVFNRFWRADPSRARQTGGTGLGLSISLEDARLHGGWLEAWGQPGRGSQFRLTLPVRAGGRITESPLPLVPEDAEAAAVGDGGGAQ